MVRFVEGLEVAAEIGKARKDIPSRENSKCKSRALKDKKNPGEAEWCVAGGEWVGGYDEVGWGWHRVSG